MFVVTTDEIAGYRITRSHGHVLGTIVRMPSIGDEFGNIGSTLGGGEIAHYSRLFWENRQEAITRMWADAEQRGANAVVGMRFDSSRVDKYGEVCAFGTAVTVEPIESA